jgi:superfamily II DNA or RNA helicase
MIFKTRKNNDKMKNRNTKKILGGKIQGIDTEEKKRKTTERAIEIIKELLKVEDINSIIEIKSGERGTKAYINGVLVTGPELCYVLGELTENNDFKIKGADMRAIEYRDIKTAKLVGIEQILNGKDDRLGVIGIIERYKKDYVLKYLSEKEILDNTTIFSKISGLFDEISRIYPSDIDVDTPNPLLETIIKRTNSECPNGTRKNIITGKCENAKTEKNRLKIKDDSLDNIGEELALPKKIKQKVLLKPITKQPIEEVIIKPIIDDIVDREKTIKSVNSEPDINKVIEQVENIETQEVPEEKLVIPELKSPEIDESNLGDVFDKVNTEPMPDISDIDETREEQRLNDQIGIAPTDIESKEYNDFLFNKEKLEHENSKIDKSNDFLYPDLNDPDFNLKIAKLKEFNDTKYDGKIYDIRERTNLLCNADFELVPHQLFVKNFLSFQTPYNSLLLYHGLGTGKTCSAIGIAEEMRGFMKQVGLTQKILVVASPNVQQNFRLQLFDERKLKLENGLWNLNTCIGNNLLKEINPTSLQGISKERVTSEINSLINQYYNFVGYVELANYIKRNIRLNDNTEYSEKEAKNIHKKLIKKFFNNRLIIIDEVHNIRLADDNKKKRTASLLMYVVKHAENIRLLLLSATPMYNSQTEIIWLTNLLNLVDKRSTIKESDVFDSKGNFLEERKNKNDVLLEGGRELLRRKLTGYISYVRGENPYTFPYRIYPDVFSPENTIKKEEYPKIQMNKKEIDTPLQYVPIYVSKIGEYQQKGYEFIMNNLINKSFDVVDKFGKERIMPSFENMESFGYHLLLEPLESLNIVYPSSQLDNKMIEETDRDDERNKDIIKNMVGKTGLSNIMTYKSIVSNYSLRYDFEYKPEILGNPEHGRIFQMDKIHKYSNKIHSVCQSILNSTGIVLVYSQYIDGGIVPIALALEEMGFTRYGFASHTKPLFKTSPTEPIDALTMKPKSQYLQENGEPTKFRQAKYVMITGDKAFSPNNLADIKYITNPENKHGENVKVVLISKAAAEGVDFKNIRQVHIMEPWYNMNRIEQIIGRGVRNLSHCQLPFEERNVEIFLHSTIPNNDEEPVDMYVYRYAENKATNIGKVTRLLKEIAVDCLLNIGQTNFSVDDIMGLPENKNIKIKLSSQKDKEINFNIGDKPFSEICDYMDNCSFKCSSDVVIQDADINQTTYNNEFLSMNYSTITKRIRDLFKEHFIYKREQLINSINIIKDYPIEQIDYVLTRFIDNKNEYLLDKYSRKGYLINKEKYYIFQPIEITNEEASIYERSIPVEYKKDSLELQLPTNKKYDNKVIENEFDKISENVIANEKIQEKNKRNYDTIINDLKVNLSNSLEKTQIESSDNDWYKHCGHVIEWISVVHKIQKEKLIKYIIYHYLDSLKYDKKLVLIGEIYNPDKNLIEIENMIKQYFDEKRVDYNNEKAIVLVNDEEKWNIYYQNPSNLLEWYLINPVDFEKYKKQLTKFIIPDSKINDVVGFMSFFKNEGIVFKTKEMSDKRGGAKCSSAGKQDLMKRLNYVLGEKIYIDSNELYSQVDIRKQGLCVILEILFRYFTEIHSNVDNKHWFFDLEKTIINKIPKKIL